MTKNSKQSIKVVYMGTPEFAVLPLKKLVENGYQVELVVTQPDKARDRGKKIQFPPVKETALELGLEVAQPEKVKNNEVFLEQIRRISPDVMIVAAYGKILPVELLAIPKLGCINIHASLLPKYRGAAPIHRCIIEGEKKTGVTLMYMEEGLDTGDMIEARSLEIGKKTTAELHDQLSLLGAELLVEVLPDIIAGKNSRTPQNDEEATYAPMVFKKDGLIDFHKSPEEISCLIRGMNSWPGAYTNYGGEPMKVWEAEPQQIVSREPVGTIIEVSINGILVAAGGSTLLIKRIQMPGKKAMMVSDYLKGNKIQEGEVLN